MTNKGDNDKWSFYKDDFGGHRWVRKARNGRKVGGACEGFPTLADCEANAKIHGWKDSKDSQND